MVDRFAVAVKDGEDGGYDTDDDSGRLEVEGHSHLTFAITGGIGRRAKGALTKTVRVDGVVGRHGHHDRLGLTTMR